MTLNDNIKPPSLSEIEAAIKNQKIGEESNTATQTPEAHSPANNNEINDLLKKFEDEVKLEKTHKEETSPESSSFTLRILSKLTGGKIKTPAQANYLLIIIAILFFLLSLYFFFK